MVLVSILRKYLFHFWNLSHLNVHLKRLFPLACLYVLYKCIIVLFQWRLKIFISMKYIRARVDCTWPSQWNEYDRWVDYHIFFSNKTEILTPLANSSCEWDWFCLTCARVTEMAELCWYQANGAKCQMNIHLKRKLHRSTRLPY